MSMELERLSSLQLHRYCYDKLTEIDELVTDKLRRDIKFAKLNCKHFKKGLHAFVRVDRVLCHPQDDSAVAQELSAAEALTKEFQQEYKSKMNANIFVHQKPINAHLEMMIERFINSKYVLVNGSEDMRNKVMHIWARAYSEAEAAWAVYEPLEDRAENCYNETTAEIGKLADIREAAGGISLTHTNDQMRQLVAVGRKLQSIIETASGYLLNINGETLRKANDGIRELMDVMTSLYKQVSDERKAKMKTNVKQLQNDKKSETHVKYNVCVRVGKVEFQADVCVRNGQHPKFCAAKSRPFEPPVGMRDTQKAVWIPPTLEVQLATTNDPQTIVLKDLKASTSKVHGSFSKKDILIKLPQRKVPFSKTTQETSGNFENYPEKIPVTLTCIRKGTEKCTEYPCKEPSQTHWIDSGIRRAWNI
ncbi:hypothetical protein ACEPAH_6349 [Sanghuangporus vaninii]